MKSLALSVFWATGAFLLSSSITAPQGYIVGDQAEDFSLLNVDGRMVSMADYQHANGYVVIFTCNHCPYAEAYEDRIISLHKRFAPRGFPVIAINPNSPEIVPEDSYPAMQVRSNEKKFPYVYLFDADQSVMNRFGATRTPHVFLLDSTLTVRYIGAIDDNMETPSAVRNRYLENAINALLRGEKPSPDFTRALGCTVKKKPPPATVKSQEEAKDDSKAVGSKN
jgi:peroxiredoxin